MCSDRKRIRRHQGRRALCCYLKLVPRKTLVEIGFASMGVCGVIKKTDFYKTRDLTKTCLYCTEYLMRVEKQQPSPRLVWSQQQSILHGIRTISLKQLRPRRLAPHDRQPTARRSIRRAIRPVGHPRPRGRVILSMNSSNVVRYTVHCSRQASCVPSLLRPSVRLTTQKLRSTVTKGACLRSRAVTAKLS
jgi:hypothetical protein